MSNVFSLPHQVSLQAIGTGLGILGFRPCWCLSPFPLPSIPRCFPITSSHPAIEFQSCFFFTADVSAPIRSTLQLLTLSVSLQAWDWLWSQMLLSQMQSRGAHEAEISFQISALAGV